MRFTTFAAFILPLAALAVPTPAPPQPDSVLAQLEAARVQFANGLAVSSAAINATIDQLSGSSNSAEQAVLEGVQFANTNLGFTLQAARRANAAAQANSPDLESEQLDTALGGITAQFILKGLNQTVNDKRFSDLVDDTLDLVTLQLNIGNALNGISEIVNAGVAIVTIQGKSVKGLFDAANIVPPPGF